MAKAKKKATKKASTQARGRRSSSPAKQKGKQPKVKADPLDEYRATIKQLGIADVVALSDDEAMCNIRGRISTQSLALDKILRGDLDPLSWTGGIPMGRVTEFFGPPHIGKSTILDQCFSSVQRMGGTAILMDTEVSRDRTYTNRLGVDLDKLQYVEFGREQCFIENVIRVAYRTIDWWRAAHPDTPVVLGWDALGGTGTEDEWSKGMQADSVNKPGAAAKAMHMAARQIAPRLGGTRIAFVLSNHEYEMINTTGGRFAKKRETYGGSGVRHAGSVRVQLFSLGNLIKAKDGSVIGKEVGAKVVKNRLGDSHVQATLPMINGVGCDNIYTLYQDLKRVNICVVNGSWSQILLDGELVSFQGWLGLRAKCVEHPTLFDRLVAVWGEHCANLYVRMQPVSGSG